jgi:hypothetical protein
MKDAYIFRFITSSNYKQYGRRFETYNGNYVMFWYRIWRFAFMYDMVYED